MKFYFHFLATPQSKCADTWKSENETNSEIEMEVIEVDIENVSFAFRSTEPLFLFLL
jgi:hypothetical protein